MGSGICGSAMVRAADALLKALGGGTVRLVLPAASTASDVAGLLGLVDPGVQELLISPVVTRALVTGNTALWWRIEFTLPASGDCRPSYPRWNGHGRRLVQCCDSPLIHGGGSCFTSREVVTGEISRYGLFLCGNGGGARAALHTIGFQEQLLNHRGDTG